MPVTGSREWTLIARMRNLTYKDIMKKRFLLLCLSVLLSTTSFAASVTLAWDPSPDVVSGYQIYWGTASGVYTNSLDVGLVTQATVTGLDDGEITYYFALTAYYIDPIWGWLESDFSNEISYTTPPLVGPSLTLTPAADSRLDVSWAAVQWATCYSIVWIEDGAKNFQQRTVNSGVLSMEIALLPGSSYQLWAFSGHYYWTADNKRHTEWTLAGPRQSYQCPWGDTNRLDALLVPVLMADNTWRVTAYRAPGLTIELMNSGNLDGPWTSLGVMAEISPGVYRLTDANAHQQNFYRLSVP